MQPPPNPVTPTARVQPAPPAVVTCASSMPIIIAGGQDHFTRTAWRWWNHPVNHLGSLNLQLDLVRIEKRWLGPRLIDRGEGHAQRSFQFAVPCPEPAPGQVAVQHQQLVTAVAVAIKRLEAAANRLRHVTTPPVPCREHPAPPPGHGENPNSRRAHKAHADLPLAVPIEIRKYNRLSRRSLIRHET